MLDPDQRVGDVLAIVRVCSHDLISIVSTINRNGTVKARSELIGVLRRLGLWEFGRKAHRLLAPRVCAAIHNATVRIGPRFLPTDLVLKHIYDYRLVFVNPALVQLRVKVDSWRRSTPAVSPLARLRRWYGLGGGWKTAQRHLTRNIHGRFVAGGDWDERAERFDDLPVITQLFTERMSPKETDLYQRQLRRIQVGELAWTKGRRTQSELDEQFAELIRTFETIRATGYRTQAELGLEGGDEIRVCVDRRGRLCVYSGGSHRLAMAKLLDLPRVPVIIGRVHALWVEQWMRRAGTSDRVVAIAEGVAALESA